MLSRVIYHAHCIVCDDLRSQKPAFMPMCLANMVIPNLLVLLHITPNSHRSLTRDQVAWSSATIAGCHIPSLLPDSSPPLATFEQKTVTKAYSIIAAKGATAYGVASVVSSICESILFNQCHIRPVSHWVESRQCCISFPAVIGRGGVVKTINIPLNDEEEQSMKKSVESILGCVHDVEKRWISTAQ